MSQNLLRRRWRYDMALEESSRNSRVAHGETPLPMAALAQRSAGHGHQRPDCSGEVGGRRSSTGPGGPSWPSALPRTHGFSRYIQVPPRKRVQVVPGEAWGKVERVGGPKGHKALAGDQHQLHDDCRKAYQSAQDRKEAVEEASFRYLLLLLRTPCGITSGRNLRRSGPSSLPASRSPSHRLISHPLRPPGGTRVAVAVEEAAAGRTRPPTRKPAGGEEGAPPSPPTEGQRWEEDRC
ncbi:unnamed protein product, partial [Ectocarpus sp. 6 AP-2014]